MHKCHSSSFSFNLVSFSVVFFATTPRNCQPRFLSSFSSSPWWGLVPPQKPMTYRNYLCHHFHRTPSWRQGETVHPPSTSCPSRYRPWLSSSWHCHRLVFHPPLLDIELTAPPAIRLSWCIPPPCRSPGFIVVYNIGFYLADRALPASAFSKHRHIGGEGFPNLFGNVIPQLHGTSTKNFRVTHDMEQKLQVMPDTKTNSGIFILVRSHFLKLTIRCRQHV